MRWVVRSILHAGSIELARCSSVIIVFAYGAMNCQIDPSWWTNWARSEKLLCDNSVSLWCDGLLDRSFMVDSCQCLTSTHVYVSLQLMSMSHFNSCLCLTSTHVYVSLQLMSMAHFNSCLCLTSTHVYDSLQPTHVYVYFNFCLCLLQLMSMSTSTHVYDTLQFIYMSNFPLCLWLTSTHVYGSFQLMSMSNFNSCLWLISTHVYV